MLDALRILEESQKKGLGHLTREDVDALLADLVDRLAKVPVQCRFGWTELPTRNPLIASVHPEWVTTNEPKGVLGMLMQGCFAVPADGSQGPPAKDTEIFVSADATKIRFVGKGRKQAHGGYHGFSDVDAPPGQVFEIRPHVIAAAAWADHPLLQVADVYAYICSHADPGLTSSDRFTRLLNRMRWSRVTPILRSRAEPEGTNVE